MRLALYGIHVGVKEGGLQVMGSASLVKALIEHDLVDEYRLMIEPILLGGQAPVPRRWECAPTSTSQDDHKRNWCSHLYLLSR